MVGPAELARLVGISAALLGRHPSSEHRQVVETIAHAADAQNVSPALAVAICIVESGLRPDARYLCGVLGGPYVHDQATGVARALATAYNVCPGSPSVRRAVYRFRVGRCSPQGRRLRTAQRHFLRVNRIAQRLDTQGAQ